ncbi:MAG: Gfo/Idh/MocA family oxidoreductase [Desulfovibrionaceae bacterium]|nr:Gfo/Idh/MocA family oxidoreductase [Desulfovibrionaceae bacterium]
MSKKYKLTVIGAGDRGSVYMRAIKEFFDDIVEWDTVCDILPDRMDKAFDQFGFRAKEADWEKAIADSAPDIVVIATPAYFHCDMAMFAMRRGCHVLTEKPMDLSLAKSFALKECREQTGKVLAVGMQYRNIPSFRALQRAVEQGIFGENLMISFADIREVRPKIAMHDAVTGNGGPLVDMACHLFDLMRLYYHSDPVRVNCIWRKNAANRPALASVADKAADACFMTVEYENGALGELMLNWGMSPGVSGEFFCTVTGSDALYTTQPVPHSLPLEVFIEDFEETEVTPLPEDEDDLINPERAVVKHFLEEIEGTGKAQVSEEHGIVCLATSLAALRSGALGRPVTLEEIYRLRPTVYECMTATE